MIPTHPYIMLNGKDITAYNLVPLEGTIDTILKAPPLKKLVTNNNSYMHGVMSLANPNNRRIDKQELALSFFLYTPSMRDMYRQVTNIERMLISGESDTGINTFTFFQYDQRIPRDTDMAKRTTPSRKVSVYVGPEYLPLCLRLIYIGTKKLQPWYPTGKATVTFNFLEPNPDNRMFIDSLLK